MAKKTTRYSSFAALYDEESRGKGFGRQPKGSGGRPVPIQAGANFKTQYISKLSQSLSGLVEALIGANAMTKAQILDLINGVFPDVNDVTGIDGDGSLTVVKKASQFRQVAIAAESTKNIVEDFQARQQWDNWRRMLPTYLKMLYENVINTIVDTFPGHSDAKPDDDIEKRKSIAKDSIGVFIEFIQEIYQERPTGREFSLYCSSLEDELINFVDIKAESGSGTTSILGKRLKLVRWFTQLTSSIQMFFNLFNQIATLEETEELREKLLGGKTRDQAVSDLIDAFEGRLIQIIDQYDVGEPSDVDSIRYEAQRRTRPSYGFLSSRDELYCEAATNATEIEAEGSGDRQEIVLQLSIQSDDFDAEIAGIASGKGMDISAASVDNNHPFSGVLFPVDRPSEQIPAIGPRVPLFVPRHVAAQAVSQVRSLPVDASESLKGHSEENIVGVMNSAYISDQDEFVVSGNLFGWNKPALVSKISASSQVLGMSMNALATGVSAVVDGKQVYMIESLQLFGANILEKDRATFTSTSIAAAAGTKPKSSQSEDPQQTEIAASAASQSTEINTEETIMTTTNEELAALIQQSNESHRQAILSIASAVGELSEAQKIQAEALQQQQVLLASIEEERNLVKAEALARDEAEKARTHEQDLLDKIAKMINPTGAPNRRTSNPVAIAASSIGVSEASSDSTGVMARLIKAQASLETMRSLDHSGPDRVALVEEVRELKMQAAALGIAV